VVERGSFIEVPRAIRLLATIRFTEALILSKAGAEGSSEISVCLKRLMIKSLNLSGKRFFTFLFILTELRTTVRAMAEDPNFSTPSDCRLRLIPVSTTPCAFLLVTRVTIMTIPAMTRNRKGTSTSPMSISILKVSGSTPPEILHAFQDENPAMGTPIKFTRSLPANAIARAKVPARTTTVNISILKSQ